MSKDIKRLCILSLFLIILSIITITLLGNTYELNYLVQNSNKDFKVDVENETGKVKILKQELKKDKYVVKVKAIKPGRVSIYLNYGDYKEGKLLYIHKNMVITDNNYFGKSTLSEIIPISISIILLYSLYILIKKYRKHKKENIYQYKNISYLGIIIFLSFFTLNNILSVFNYQGLYNTIDRIINSISFVSFLLFPIALITSILVTISNINLIIKEGKSLKNMLGLFLGIFICISSILPDFIYSILMKLQIVDIYNLNSIGPYIYNFFESLIYLTIAYLECVLLGTIIIAVKAIKKDVEYNKDYMLILGCKIRNDGTLTPLLRGRVDRAIEFRNKQLEKTNKDLIFIPSGGKGNDEVIAEAEAIKNYLLEQGIKDKNILLENKSKNTYENIKYSYKLIKNKNSNICFSTTNYHVLRAGLIATEQGIKIDGIGSKTKTYFWINAFIREFIGTLYSEKKRHIIVFLTILLIIISMIWIMYIANNI